MRLLWHQDNRNGCVDKSKLSLQHRFSTPEGKTRESYVHHMPIALKACCGGRLLRCYRSAADTPVVPNMTGREPVNIRRLLRENDQYAAADEYARDVQKGDAVSSWHEHQSRKSSRPEQMPPQNLQSVDFKVVACSPKDRLQRKYVLFCLTPWRAARLSAGLSSAHFAGLLRSCFC